MAGYGDRALHFFAPQSSALQLCAPQLCALELCALELLGVLVRTVAG